MPLPMIHRRSRAIAITFGLAAMLAASLAYAHHGFSGRYDLRRPVWVEGIVVGTYFGNPHSELTVEISGDLALPQPLPSLGPAASFLDGAALVVPEDIRGRTVELELPPTRQYSGFGDRIKEGDRIAAVAIRNCAPPHQLNVQWLRLADGSVESRNAAMSYMVESCD